MLGQADWVSNSTLREQTFIPLVDFGWPQTHWIFTEESSALADNRIRIAAVQQCVCVINATEPLILLKLALFQGFLRQSLLSAM